MTTLCVLVCQEHKWFVGLIDPSRMTTVIQYFKSMNHEWLTTYPPIGVSQIIKHSSVRDVTEYMKRYGINNVRGGKYSVSVLPRRYIDELTKEFGVGIDVKNEVILQLTVPLGDR